MVYNCDCWPCVSTNVYGQTRYRRKQLMYITNFKRLTEEASIFWVYLCGWKFTDDHDNGTSISEKITEPVVTGHQQNTNKTVTTGRKGTTCFVSTSG